MRGVEDVAPLQSLWVTVYLCEAERKSEHNTGGASPSPTEVCERAFVCAKPKDSANNVAAGCKHTPLRSVASLLRKHCPRPTNVTFYRCTPVITYFPTTILSPPWQSIFISAQGSLYTIKTVGGEAVRRFFSLENALFLFYCLHFI